MLIVKKYGGSSVSTPEKLLTIAKGLKNFVELGHKLIVIVSAMGDTTDDLVGLSRRITTTPNQREMDMLLSAGERVSMSLLAMALQSLGCDAISFTGSQSGVFTDGRHNSARISEIKAFRVEEELSRGRVVIIAGFQGVNPATKEITTLGRGGSDTTAVAMAAQFHADRCDILTDVRGLYSIDPRVPGVTPHQLMAVDYETTLEMAYWGARVLHYRSVELAERRGIPLLVHLSSEEGSGTIVSKMETTEIKAVNYNSQIAALKFGADYSTSTMLKSMHESLRAAKLPLPQIIYVRPGEIFFHGPAENNDNVLKNILQWASVAKKTAPELHAHFATVTVTGRGLVNSELAFRMSEFLNGNEIATEAVIPTPLSVSFLILKNQVQKASQLLHQKFVEPFTNLEVK